jgi:hypothetical protein
MADSSRLHYQNLRLGDFLRDQPGLRVQPVVDSSLKLAGTFTFLAASTGSERIDDSFEIEIIVPSGFPGEFPTVKETAGRIAKSFHTNPDGTLCLGAPTRLRLAIADSPTLPAFAERCLVPYLYGFSLHAKNGKLPFGELYHGFRGICQDYADIYGIKCESAAMEMVRLTSLKKRVANKHPCPCGSNRRLGRCHNLIINRLRHQLGRSWFRKEYQWLAENAREP